MNRIFLTIVLVFFFFCSNGQTYFIVRHAEKAAAGPNMTSDVPLTEEGKKRAEAVKDILSGKKIGYVYSTSTMRTKATAQPTADYFKLPVATYGPMPDSSFIELIKSKDKNVLIVGHSNTVDDLVNMLMGSKAVPGDLPDSEYNKLFIVKIEGKKAEFTETSIFPVSAGK